MSEPTQVAMTESRTRDYVQRRFGEYYEGLTLLEPANSESREWGLTRWTETEEGITRDFTRHLSIFELGDITERAIADRPLHMYVSTADYENPTSTDVDSKGWRGGDVTFFIELENIPEIDETDTETAHPRYDACKSELITLLARLDDLHITHLAPIFTGDGFRVQIQDEDYRQLRESERAELLDYVTAAEFDSDIFDPTYNGDTTVSDVLAHYVDGWGRDLHDEFMDYIKEIRQQGDREEQREQLETVYNISDKSSGKIQNLISSKPGLIEAGRGDKYTPAVNRLLREKLEDFIEEHRVAINSPRTTNPHAFVRLPNTLNGDTGLRVTSLERDEIEQFDPTIDPIPDLFRGKEIDIQVTSAGTYSLAGSTLTVEEGLYTVPEPLGLYLMLQNRAELSNA